MLLVESWENVLGELGEGKGEIFEKIPNFRDEGLQVSGELCNFASFCVGRGLGKV